MVSCFSSEVTPQSDLTKIKFGAAINAAASRAEDPAITTGNIDAFDVWAFMNEPTGVVFSQERVSKNSAGEWSYANTAYWCADRSYYFVALAPVDHSNIEIALANDPYIAKEGLGSVTFTNLDGTDDVIYSAPTIITTPATITSMPVVGLNFKHLLSKIRFSFKNCFLNNEKLVVSDIKVVAKNKAAIDLTQPTFAWALDANAADVELDFGHAKSATQFAIGEWASCDKNRMTIPADASQEYAVSFNVVIYYGDQPSNAIPVTTTIKNCEFKMGTQYHFKVELSGDEMGLHPIVFGQPEVTDWVTDSNPEQDTDLGLK